MRPQNHVYSQLYNSHEAFVSEVAMYVELRRARPRCGADKHEWLRWRQLARRYRSAPFSAELGLHNAPPGARGTHYRFLKDFLVTLGNYQIKREQSVKYLGVIVDVKLDWSSHLKQIETKLDFASSVIYKTRNILPLNTLKLLYYSFAYTHLSYCVTAGGLQPRHI